MDEKLAEILEEYEEIQATADRLRKLLREAEQWIYVDDTARLEKPFKEFLVRLAEEVKDG